VVNPLDRCLAYVDKMEPAVSGAGGHNATFAVACETVRFGLDDVDALSVLNWYNSSRCTPPWSSRELAHKLTSARQECGPEAGIRLRDDQPASSGNGHGRAIPWDGFIGGEPAAPVLGRRPEWETADMPEFLQSLFRPGELISYNVDAKLDADGRWKPDGYGIRGRLLETFLTGESAASIVSPHTEAGAWVRLNPMDGKGIADKNVKDYRHALVESDSMPVEAQLALINKLRLPCAAIVHSGGKSIHAVVKIEAGGDLDLYRARVKRLYGVLAAHGMAVDGHNGNPSRLSRLPGVKRGESPQYLIATLLGAASWGDWDAAMAAEPAPGEFADLTNWLTMADQPVPWIFESAIPDLTVTVVGAQGGLGKSMFITGLALSAVLGRTLFPSFQVSAPIPVLFLAGEDSLPIICRRIRAYVSANEISPDEVTAALTSRLFLQSMQAHPMLELASTRTLKPTAFFDSIKAAARARAAKLVIIDTSRKFGGIVNEIDNAQVGAFMEVCAQLAKDCHCAVVVLHHSSKIAADEKEAKQTDLRGGSAFGDEARCVWVLKRRKDKRIEASNQKMSYGTARRPVVLEFLEDGALVESNRRSDDKSRLAEEDAQLAVLAVREWVIANPNIPVSATRVCHRQQTEEAKALFEAMGKRFIWMTWTRLAEVVGIGLRAGILDDVKVKIGRAYKAAIIPGKVEKW